MGDLSDRMSGQDGITSLGAYMQAMRPSAEPAAKILPWRECDWPEDSANGEENGDYFNRCADCGTQFRGHKRRNRCKSCVTFVHPEEADEPQPAAPPQPAVGEQTTDPQNEPRTCPYCDQPRQDTFENRFRFECGTAILKATGETLKQGRECKLRAEYAKLLVDFCKLKHGAPSEESIAGAIAEASVESPEDTARLQRICERLEQTPQQTQTARECGKCGEPILDTRAVRHFGFFIAHPEDRCIQLLRSRIALAEDRADRAEAEAKRELNAAQARIAELESELEAHAWEISPAMAQAKIDELNAKCERLEQHLALSEDNARQSLMEIEAMRGDEHRLQEALAAERRRPMGDSLPRMAQGLKSTDSVTESIYNTQPNESTSATSKTPPRSKR